MSFHAFSVNKAEQAMVQNVIVSNDGNAAFFSFHILSSVSCCSGRKNKSKLPITVIITTHIS